MPRDDDLRLAQGVAEEGAEGRGNRGTGVVPLGTLSALLEELAASPEEPEAPAPEPEPGTTIGRFELVREIGRGGFGVVFEARDRKLDRLVAFKLVRPGRRADLREERLQREAEAAARLSHDNIVALHDVGQSDYGPYLVLELLRGRTLHERLKDGPLEPAEALRIFREVARGVAHAHVQGVIHRDLKPANVFLCEDGRVKVLDFGLAHAFGQRRQSGGTPAYMAPEQRREAPEDERTDVFALGVILHQLLAGSLPFEGEKEAAGSQRAPALEIPGSPALGMLVGRMLEKDPLRRPRDAGKVLSALERAMAQLARAAPGPVRTRRHPRWRMTALVAAGAALGLGGLLAWDHLRRLRSGGERIPVAVADVVNETGEKDLDVLSGLLVTSLEQSKTLAVLTQARVLDLAAKLGRTGATRVDEVIGREVGKERRVRALLLPAVHKLGGIYLVDMRAVDPVKDEHLFTVSDRAATKEALVDLLDRLSDRTRQELKEDPADLEGSRIALGTAMTRSMEAYGHYVLGMELRYRDGLRAAAMREQEKAVEIDPQFAAAHAQLGYMAGAYGAVSDIHRERAYRDMERMPEKERLLIRLQRAAGSSLRTNPQEQVRVASEIVQRFPESKAEVAFAGAYLALNGRRDDAERAFRGVLRFDPGYGYAVASLVAMLEEQGRAQEALEAARRGVGSRGSALNRSVLASALQASGATKEAAAQALEVLALDDGQSAEIVGGACDVLSFLGRGLECLPFLDRIATAGLNRGERLLARCKAAALLAIHGRVREAAAAGEPECGPGADVGRARHDAPTMRARVGMMGDPLLRRNALAFFGDERGAAEADAAVPPNKRDPAADLLYRGLVASAQGRHDEAVRSLEAFVAPLRTAPGDLGGGDWFAGHYLLAEALLSAGRTAEAAAVDAKDPRTGEDGDVAANSPRLALVRARALEQRGRRAEALAEVDALLDIWKGADRDLPLHVLARTMRHRLAAGSSPPPLRPPVAPAEILAVTPEEQLEVALRDVAAHRTAGTLAWLASAQRRAGLVADAAESARAAARAPEERTVRHLLVACEVLQEQGSLEVCEEARRLGMGEAASEVERQIHRRGLAYLLAYQGKAREAAALVPPPEEAGAEENKNVAWVLQVGRPRTDAPEALARVPRMAPAARRAWYLAFFGRVDEARQAWAALPEPERTGAPLRWRVEPFLLARDRRLGAAADAFRSLRDEEARRGDTSLPIANALLGEALLAAGRPGEAAAVEHVRTHHDFLSPLFHATSYPRLALVRARALEQLGRRAEAMKELDGVIDFWKKADDDLPLLVEAKAMRKRLAAAPGRK